MPTEFNAITATLITGIIVAVISALATGIVSIITAWKLNTVARAQEVAVTRMDVVAADTASIKGHVNSEKTAAEGREALLRRENELLKGHIAESKATADLLAQAVATRSRSNEPLTTAINIPASAISETLESIDKNTEAIDKNTQRTDDTIQKIEREKKK